MYKSTQPHFLAGKLALLMVCTLTIVGTAKAFNELNNAQTLIYDTAHLQNTQKDQVLIYSFQAQEAGEELVLDSVKLSVQKEHDNGTRDVTVDFLSDDRHIAFPDFPGFKGNPVIIAMLEHVAQKMGRDTGGGALYFRNRIRDALAAGVTINNEKATVMNTEVDTVVLTFSPFLDDQYIRGLPHFVNSKFTISFSESVSGGLVGIEVISADSDQTYFAEELLLEK